MFAICVTLGAVSTVRPAVDGDRSVFADLRVTADSVEWHGLRLGMSQTDVESVLGHQIAARQSDRYPRRANARVERDGQSLELAFRTSDSEQTLIGIVAHRMSSEDPAAWQLANLVQSLRAAVPDVTPMRKLHPTMSTVETVPGCYSFPITQNILLQLRPDEDSIYLALSELWIDD
jgi:hypothetical protein